MNMQQKALIVRTGSGSTRGLDELNMKLGRGWRVAHLAPMGGGASREAEALFLAALVVIERAEEPATEVLEQVEEEPEELLGELAEGNGAGLSEEMNEDMSRRP